MKKEKVDNVVKIHSSPDKIGAEMILELLRRNDIPAYKQGVASSGVMDIYTGNSIFGEDIYVNKDNEEAARELIACFMQEN